MDFSANYYIDKHVIHLTSKQCKALHSNLLNFLPDSFIIKERCAWPRGNTGTDLQSANKDNLKEQVKSSVTRLSNPAQYY